MFHDCQRNYNETIFLDKFFHAKTLKHKLIIFTRKEAHCKIYCEVKTIHHCVTIRPPSANIAAIRLKYTTQNKCQTLATIETRSK